MRKLIYSFLAVANQITWSAVVRFIIKMQFWHQMGMIVEVVHFPYRKMLFVFSNNSNYIYANRSVYGFGSRCYWYLALYKQRDYLFNTHTCCTTSDGTIFKINTYRDTCVSCRSYVLLLELACLRCYCLCLMVEKVVGIYIPWLKL